MRFVKIGYSARPYQRLSQLGTLRPGNHALRIIGWLPGTLDTERWIHGKFASSRDNGEWFRDSVPLRQFIAALGLIEPQPEPETVCAPKVVHVRAPSCGVHSIEWAPQSILCECLRCYHSWLKRVAGRPIRCPNCKEHDWDVAAGEMKRGRPRRRR